MKTTNNSTPIRESKKPKIHLELTRCNSDIIDFVLEDKYPKGYNLDEILVFLMNIKQRLIYLLKNVTDLNECESIKYTIRLIDFRIEYHKFKTNYEEKLYKSIEEKLFKSIEKPFIKNI